MIASVVYVTNLTPGSDTTVPEVCSDTTGASFAPLTGSGDDTTT
jgi:hypothetical protein